MLYNGSGDDFMSAVLIMLLIWNIYVLFLYGFDKMRARNEGRRIREKTLILCAFLFGSVGAMFGMVVFNHKTSKIKFRILIPLSVLFNAGIMVLIECFM